MFFKRKAAFTFSKENLKNKYFKNCIDNCSKLKTNLVVASYYLACDEETAKYRGRVFCIDGTDKRFPVLSDDVLKCDLSFSPFIYGVDLFEINDKKMDPVRYSNRSFVDNRTAKEKADYKNFVLKNR